MTQNQIPSFDSYLYALANSSSNFGFSSGTVRYVPYFQSSNSSNLSSFSEGYVDPSVIGDAAEKRAPDKNGVINPLLTKQDKHTLNSIVHANDVPQKFKGNPFAGTTDKTAEAKDALNKMKDNDN